MFRITRLGFYKLLSRVRLELKHKNVNQAIRSSGSPISVTTKLAATLRWLAGGSYLDICGLFGLDFNNFFHENYILWETIKALDRCLYLTFSLDPVSLKKTSDGFARLSRGHLHGCVSAIDGWVGVTRQPTIKEVGPCVSSYRNRKQCFGLVIMAGCDSTCKFNIFSCQTSGGTHDSLAWEMTSASRMIEAGELPNEFFIIGDEAVESTNHLLTPWSGSNLGLWKDSFNYHLSSMRQCIERAFGL
jgi:hypothetical protein